MKLPANFSPASAANAAGAKRHSWMKLGDGMWSGSIYAAGNGEAPLLVVEELATSWKVTDVSAGRSSSGRDLEQLLTKALKGAS